MDALIEVLKTSGAGSAALPLVVLGWVAREVFALRRSVRDQGKLL